jgi:hypothetical protein
MPACSLTFLAWHLRLIGKLAGFCPTLPVSDEPFTLNFSFDMPSLEWLFVVERR